MEAVVVLQLSFVGRGLLFSNLDISLTGYRKRNFDIVNGLTDSVMLGKIY